MSGAPDDVVQRRRLTLGAKLKSLRREAGLTQERVALKADLDRSFYVDVENGHQSLTVDRLFAVADALSVPASQLLDGVE